MHATIRRARESYANDQWAVLTGAHVHLMHGRVRAALHGFRTVLRGITDLMGDSLYAWPTFSGSPHVQSAAAALVYLHEFFQLTKMWQSYTVLAAPIRQAAGYAALPATIRAHIEAGWWISHIGVLPYDEVRDGIDATLALVAGDYSADGRWARTVAHLAAAEVNSRAFWNDAALEHARAALDHSHALASPYFLMRAYEEVGNAYYNAATVHDDPALYAACAEALDLGDAAMEMVGEDAWPMSRDYDRGWLYNRLKQFDDAVIAFQNGALRRAGGDLMYDAGRCYYGMGYALLMADKPDEARRVLHKALHIFSDDDHEQMNQDALGAGTRSAQMLGLVLQILGIVERVAGRYRAALAHLEQSREHLLAVTNPGPWYDTLIPLIDVCAALKQQHRLAFYAAELVELRTKFDVPDHGETGGS